MSAENAIGLDPDDPASKDDIVTINNLNVPVGKPTILRMTSKDVIHDFQVTNFRNKQDIVPGLETMLWFEPTVEGKYEIGCAQLCGLGHTKMVGNVFVQSPGRVRRLAEAADRGEGRYRRRATGSAGDGFALLRSSTSWSRSRPEQASSNAGEMW